MMAKCVLCYSQTKCDVGLENTAQGAYKWMKSIGCEKTDQLYLDTLHWDVVDHPNDATGPGDSQQRMACVCVVGPGTRIEVLICLYTHLVKENKTKKLSQWAEFPSIVGIYCIPVTLPPTCRDALIFNLWQNPCFFKSSNMIVLNNIHANISSMTSP